MRGRPLGSGDQLRVSTGGNLDSTMREVSAWDVRELLAGLGGAGADGNGWELIREAEADARYLRREEVDCD